jgi:hypothetical protein
MLTEAEKQELALLEQEMGAQMNQVSETVNNLTPEEQQELALLEQEFAPQEEPGIMSSIGSGLQATGEFIDQYGGGAATRAAIGALQEDKDPMSAFAEQYGEDPSLFLLLVFHVFLGFFPLFQRQLLRTLIFFFYETNYFFTCFFNFINAFI